MRTNTGYFSVEYLTKFWISEKPITYKKRRFRVGKMSYGDWFLEPTKTIRGETKGFGRGTLWLERTFNPRIWRIIK